MTAGASELRRPANQAKPRNPPIRRKTVLNRPKDFSKPLHNLEREQFCRLIANGMKVADAYTRAGYKGSGEARSDLRNAPDVVGRLNWMLGERVKREAMRVPPEEKVLADSKARLLRELERIAYSRITDVVAWERKPVFNAAGDVTGFVDEMEAKPSHGLSADTIAGIKSVKTKAGAIQIETQDKLQALEKLMKFHGIGNEPPAAAPVTVNQLNVGDVSAVEAARKVAYMLAAIQSRGQLIAPEPEPAMVDVTPKPDGSQG